MRAFWTFVRSDGAGAPLLPAGHGGRYTNPLDIHRITGGPPGNEHNHLLLGGFALADDNLSGQPGDGHTHIVANIGGNYAQITRGTVDHAHDLNTDANSNLVPEWFLLFWQGPDAGAALISSDANCYPVVEATIDADGNAGDLDNTAWTTQERNTWVARCLALLGFELPAEVDRGKRLVVLFAGVLLSRANQTERALR